MRWSMFFFRGGSKTGFFFPFNFFYREGWSRPPLQDARIYQSRTFVCCSTRQHEGSKLDGQSFISKSLSFRFSTYNVYTNLIRRYFIQTLYRRLWCKVPTVINRPYNDSYLILVLMQRNQHASIALPKGNKLWLIYWLFCLWSILKLEKSYITMNKHRWKWC